MRKRSTRKSSAAASLVSPPPKPSAKAAERSPMLSPEESPSAQFKFNVDRFKDIDTSLNRKNNKNGGAGASASKSHTLSPAESPAGELKYSLDGFKDIKTGTTNNSNKKGGAGASAFKLMQPTGLSPLPQRSLNSVRTISDLRDLASSILDSIKKRLERSDSEILKDIEASQSRLRKRLKIQTQACEQLKDEAEKEYKKISERITADREALKASYDEFIADTKATASQFSKSISEFSQKTEKDIASLRSRYGIPAA